MVPSFSTTNIIIAKAAVPANAFVPIVPAIANEADIVSNNKDIAPAEDIADIGSILDINAIIPANIPTTPSIIARLPKAFPLILGNAFIEYINTPKAIITAVQKWILKYEWEEKDFIKEIENKFCAENLTIDQKFLYTSFWYLEQNIIDKGLPIALEKAYKGELSADNLISLLGQISGLKLNGMEIDETIDYDKMYEGLNIREERIKKGELKEQRSWQFLPPENIAALKDDKAVELYRRLDNIEERVGAINRYRDFCDYLKNPDEHTTRGIDFGSIYCFDDELLDIFYNSFIKQPNGLKREMCSVLCRINIDYKQVSTKEEIEKSKENLRELVRKLNKKSEEVENKLDKCIYTFAVKSIEEKQKL